MLTLTEVYARTGLYGHDIAGLLGLDHDSVIRHFSKGNSPKDPSLRRRYARLLEIPEEELFDAKSAAAKTQIPEYMLPPSELVADPITVFLRISRHLTLTGLSDAEVAERLGLPLSKWLRRKSGDIYTGRDFQDLICEALGASWAEIYAYEQDQKSVPAPLPEPERVPEIADRRVARFVKQAQAASLKRLGISG